MPVIGTPRNFHKKFKWVAEFDGVGSAAFRDCSELSGELDKVEHREGGVIIPVVKDPGLLNFTDITLGRGASNDLDLYNWWKEAADAARQGGTISPLFKRMGDLVQLDLDGSVLLRWRIHNAWPPKFSAGDWDNEASEVRIEQVVLTYDFFEPIAA